MRIPGSSFSASYDKLLQLNAALAEDAMEDHLLEWSRDVADLLQEIFTNGKFKVVVEILPNPSSENGMDAVKIDVWQTEDNSIKPSPLSGSVTLVDSMSLTDLGDHFYKFNFKPFIKVTSGRHDKISDSIKEINEKLDGWVKFKEAQADIIEVDGKRYKLIKE